MKTEEVHAYWRWWLQQKDKYSACPVERIKASRLLGPTAKIIACEAREKTIRQKYMAFCVEVCDPLYSNSHSTYAVLHGHCPCNKYGVDAVVKRVRVKLAKAKKAKP
jgi:hypothetical protein